MLKFDGKTMLTSIFHQKVKQDPPTISSSLIEDGTAETSTIRNWGGTRLKFILPEKVWLCVKSFKQRQARRGVGVHLNWYKNVVILRSNIYLIRKKWKSSIAVGGLWTITLADPWELYSYSWERTMWWR